MEIYVTDFLAPWMGIFTLPETMNGWGVYLEMEMGRQHKGVMFSWEF